MTDKTSTLGLIVLDIARAKQDRKAKKKLLKDVPEQELGNLETSIPLSMTV